MRRTIDTVRVEKMLTEAFDERHERVRERLHVDPCSDPIDEARHVEDAAVATEQLDTVWQNRRQAQAALERLRAGGYGVCASCNREISPARLDAHPVATRCLRCEQVYEAYGFARCAQSNVNFWADWDPFNHSTKGFDEIWVSLMASVMANFFSKKAG